MELDEIDFDTLVEANLKFNMDIPMFKIRHFLEMTCDEFNDNLTFVEKNTVAIFVKLIVTKALVSLREWFFLDWDLFDRQAEKKYKDINKKIFDWEKEHYKYCDYCIELKDGKGQD